MNTSTASFETILTGVAALSPAELDVLQAQIARSRQTKIFSPKNVFEIPYREYLSFSESEREALQWRVYQEHNARYQAELKKRRAQWLLVCGGEILEHSRTLDDYPAPEKLQAVGQDRGVIPFVFVPKPLIEESSWSALDDDDFYPTLPLQLSSAHETQSKSSFMVTADFDTGSPHLFVDYDKLAEERVLSFRPKSEAFFEQHLGGFYRFHILLLQVALLDESGNLFANRMHAYCVRDWQNSPLCLVNSNRQALAGRNLLLRFPIKVELDGQKQTTRVLGKKKQTSKRT